ncbi:MAG: YtxH domain-containing protein [Myxacorys chilensis ATA2-1-KO14]|jgi:gas vesicle protein|nr:YtxH domain-containing protein [Myxacorys chilensis ATA2-1-KO14]
MSNNRSGAFLGGMIVGAAIGAIAGILATPRTGEETRQLLKKSADALPDLAEDLSTTVQLQADRLSETAMRNWDGTLGRLREAISAGVEATREDQLLNRDAERKSDSQPPLRDRLR